MRMRGTAITTLVVGALLAGCSGATSSAGTASPSAGPGTSGPPDAGASQRNGRVWVANSGTRTVSVLDADGGELIADVAFETGVHGLAAAAGSIWVLDLHGPKFVTRLTGHTVWRLNPAALGE